LPPAAALADGAALGDWPVRVTDAEGAKGGGVDEGGLDLPRPALGDLLRLEPAFDADRFSELPVATAAAAEMTLAEGDAAGASSGDLLPPRPYSFTNWSRLVTQRGMKMKLAKSLS
jgi:hypothetical protein